MKEVTNVTIISTNLNKSILSNYNDYKIIDFNFNNEDLLKYKNIIFYNILNSLNDNKIKELYEFLTNNNINFINITNNINQILLTKYLIIYNDNIIIKEGLTKELLKDDKLFTNLGFDLPFIIRLSIFLKDYNLINDICYDKESLIGILWK